MGVGKWWWLLSKRVPWILYHDSAVKVMPRGFNDSVVLI
jgi:hypothetical protein